MLSRLYSNKGMLLLLAMLLLGFMLHHVWMSEAALSTRWVPDEEARRFAQQPLRVPDGRSLIGEYELPLHTDGRDIVDAQQQRFRLLAVNWYGASDVQFVAGGLDVQHRAVIAQTIRSLGFNTVRLPYSDEMVMANSVIPAERVAANADLAGQRALDVFVATVQALTDAGLAVIVNNHITAARWCCDGDPCDAGWANDHLPGMLCRVRQTEEEWMAHWETVMGRLADNALVIGADLRNEVRGLWGTMRWERWATAAERCGNRLLALKPTWLVVVGGTESGNDLSGVARRPVRLAVDRRVVYAAHVYSWSGWGSREGRFAGRTYDSFAAAMRTSWAYVLEQDEAPVWVAEFGAPRQPSVGDARYWQHLVRFLAAVDADLGYWAVNPRKPDRKGGGNGSEETYALVRDDWQTPVLDYRMRDLSRLMQTDRQMGRSRIAEDS